MDSPRAKITTRLYRSAKWAAGDPVPLAGHRDVQQPRERAVNACHWTSIVAGSAVAVSPGPASARRSSPVCRQRILLAGAVGPAYDRGMAEVANVRPLRSPASPGDSGKPRPCAARPALVPAPPPEPPCAPEPL